MIENSPKIADKQINNWVTFFAISAILYHLGQFALAEIAYRQAKEQVAFSQEFRKKIIEQSRNPEASDNLGRPSK